MRISDWSSDVCSSDLEGAARRQVAHHDAIAVIVVDRRDLAEQRDAVGTLLRRPRWLDRPRSRLGAFDQLGLRHRLAVDEALHLADVEDRKSNTSELQSLMRTSYALFCLPTTHTADSHVLR